MDDLLHTAVFRYHRKMQWLWGTITILMAILSVLSCWNVALRLYRAWWYPLIADNGTWVRFGVGIMVMEFFVVHSGGLLTGASISTSNAKARWAFLSGLIAFYFGAAYLISYLFHSSSLFYSFASIMFCRLITGFFAVSENNLPAVTQRSVMSGMLYLFVCFLSVGVPFPKGGLTPRVLSQFYPEGGEGIWNQEPQRALAAGIIYFLFMGIYELFAARENIKRSSAMAAAQAQFYGKRKS